MVCGMTTPWLETTLTPAELRQLEQWVQAHGTPQQVVVRSRIALAAAAGRSDLSIAAALDVNRHTVRLWRQRIGQAGVGTVWEIASGRGRKARYGARKRDQIIRATLHDRPRGQTHWSCRTLAAAHGVSKNTINRLWQLHNLKPHLQRTFKLSRDPQFLEKLTDVVGLYLNPPQHAVVICVDEKSQIQALDRTQPGLPLKKGRCGTYTHDYKRNGTTTLFAALSMLDGKVIGQCQTRHRQQEWLKFLRRLDREFSPDLTLHVQQLESGQHHPAGERGNSPAHRPRWHHVAGHPRTQRAADVALRRRHPLGRPPPPPPKPNPKLTRFYTNGVRPGRLGRMNPADASDSVRYTIRKPHLPASPPEATRVHKRIETSG